MDKTSKYKKVLKLISFGILIFVATTTLVAMIWQGVSAESKITDKIYSINGFLFGASILSIMLHMLLQYSGKYVVLPRNVNFFSIIISAIANIFMHSLEKILSGKSKNRKNVDVKSTLKRIWPCILLVVFMGWTAVGCIQASMEASAEAALKAGIETERNKEIAAWTSGNRMENAADRSWNGCDNLKDGYFSFLFYAMVAVNVVMLGAKSDKLKKYLLRTLMMVAILLVLFSFLSIFDPTFLGGMVHYKRAIFNNSNHYGYFLCIATVLCTGLFIKEKNIYFKGMAFLGFVLMSFMLIANNTFGAYLGVMIALSLIFLAIIVELLISYIKVSENIPEKIKEFICILAMVGIFTFFSCTLIDVTSKKSTSSKGLYVSCQIVTTFGEHKMVINQETTNAVVVTSSFKLSGDNRIYTMNGKQLKLVDVNSELDPNKQYYKLYGYPYEIISDDTVTEIKTPEEYSNTTIVANNFNTLFKDIKTLLNYFEKENNDEEKKISDNEIVETISGEISGAKVEVTSNEGVNEKSGLSEDVSSTGSGRGEVWLTSLKLIAQRPVFGWGLENLLNEFYYQYGVNEGRTHNLILQLAGTTGIFGMLFYMIAVIGIFFKVMARYRNWGLIEYVTVPTFIAYMVSSMFGNSAFYTSPYFMIILGMMIATTLFKGKELSIEEEKINEKR